MVKASEVAVLVLPADGGEKQGTGKLDFDFNGFF